jgi:hypothetical protein
VLGQQGPAAAREIGIGGLDFPALDRAFGLPRLGSHPSTAALLTDTFNRTFQLLHIARTYSSKSAISDGDNPSSKPSGIMDQFSA